MQFQPHLLEVDYNLSRMQKYVCENSADLFVFPELATSGYVFATQAEVDHVSESIPDGICFEAMRELAIQRHSSIIYGFAEKAAGKTYNSSILINPDGTYHLYRKIHLFNREKLFFCAGDLGFNVVPAKNGVLIGMMICFDWQFPEAARTLAIKGAQIICHPSNLVLPWCQEAMKTRSLENRLFTVTANRIGLESNQELQEFFTGMSQITGNKGEILLRLSTDQEEIGIVEIDPVLAKDKTVTERNNAMTDRRPEFYYHA